MTDKLKNNYPFLLLAAGIGTALLFVPLLGDFHLESAMLASVIGCFWAAIRACNEGALKDDFHSALTICGYLFLAAIPLLIYALITGCFSTYGLAFWLILPIPSVFFGYGIGRLLRSWGIPYRRSISVFLLLLIAVGLFAIEFFNYPQVFFFNHVWGVWPGPIYDETIKVTGSMVFFRCLTLLWVTVLWHIPIINKDRLSRWILGLSVVSLLLGYINLTDAGILRPASTIQQKLGGHKTTPHFKLYYDQDLYTNHEIEELAKEHEFYMSQIADTLKLALPDSTNRIESYLYGNPWQKKKLVGAKFTSYVPVWLHQDQLHIAKQQIPGSLKHELVHVMAKQFGNKLFSGSWSIGLIEGTAVAIAGGSSKTSTTDQIVVSEKPYPKTKIIEHKLSPWGFYGGRSGVNYTTSGSFIKYLLKEYPASSLKKAYRSADLKAFYHQDLKTLIQGWHQHLDSVQVDSVDVQTAARIFSIPSLFEKQCPHTISYFSKSWDQYQLNMANQDTAAALESLDYALAASDSVAPVKATWCFQNLVAGNASKVAPIASLQDTTIDLQLLYADAFALQGKMDTARQYLKQAEVRYQQNPDSLHQTALRTRQNDRQWDIYRQLTYYNNMPDSATFSTATYRTKIRSLRKALDTEQWNKGFKYGRMLLKKSPKERYFSDYLKLIHELAFFNRMELAQQWISYLSSQSLRQRHAEKLKQERQWIKFLSGQ